MIKTTFTFNNEEERDTIKKMDVLLSNFMPNYCKQQGCSNCPFYGEECAISDMRIILDMFLKGIPIKER